MFSDMDEGKADAKKVEVKDDKKTEATKIEKKIEVKDVKKAD